MRFEFLPPGGPLCNVHVLCERCELGSSVSRETDQTRPDQTEDAMIASWTLALSGSDQRERGEVRGQPASQGDKEKN